MPFKEEGADEVLKNVVGKTLFVSGDRQSISQSRYVVIVIGTPVDEHLNPKFKGFRDFFLDIMDLIKDGQHIVLRSTVYPGTTEKVAEMLKSAGKRAGVSFCPERIAEGKAMEELRSLPQIVSAFDEEALKEAKELFLSLTDDIVFLEPAEAEIAKLFINVWRYIKFSISNQFYLIALQNGFDYYKIYNAIKHNYPRAQGFPSAGFTAGPCLFKDTMQLAAYSNNTFFLGHAAMLVNEGLPNFIVQKLKEKYPLKEKTVGILGMAFKGESDDVRESLSYKLRKILDIEAKKTLCADPFVKDNSLVSMEEAISGSDIIILGAPHSMFRELDLDTSSKVVVDVWNFFGKGSTF
jgi:UDP-N-acetyl-D-mannosaminuronic acid dehydrogenase